MHKSSIVKRDLRSRYRRLGLVLLLLYIGYFAADFLFKNEMFVINYVIYPFSAIIVIYNFRFFSLFEFFKFFKFSSARAKVYIQYIFKIALLLSTFSFMMPLLVALFLKSTYDAQINLDDDVYYYMTHLWSIIPLPAIVAYMYLYNFLMKKGLNNIYKIVNDLIPCEIRNDSIHNLLIAFHSVSCLSLVILLISTAIYIFYLWLCYCLSFDPIKGANLISIICSFFLIIVVSAKKFKKILKRLGSNSWSIAQFLLFASCILLAILSICTVLIPLLHLNISFLITGGYNFKPQNINAFYLNLVSTIWWLAYPLFAVYCLREAKIAEKVDVDLGSDLRLFTDSQFMNINTNVILVLIAFSIVSLMFFGVFNIAWEEMQRFYRIFDTSKTMNTLAIVLVVFYLFKYLFSNRFDKNAMLLEDIYRFPDNKFRPINRSYYAIFLASSMVIVFIILENLFIVQKLLAFASIASTIVFVVFFCSLLKVPSRKLLKFIKPV